MTSSLPQLSEVETAVLDPLLMATGLQESERFVVKKQLGALITMESIKKVLTSLPESERNTLMEELSDLETEAQFDHLQKYVAHNKKSREVLTEYFQKEVPELVKELLTTFMGKATPEQKHKLLDATEAVSAR